MLTSGRHGVVATIGADAMLARTVSGPVLALVACVLGGCGSSDGPGDGSSDGGSASPDERMPAGPDASPSVDDGAFDRGPADRRVRRVSTDEDGDGVEDSAITYAYDDAGRIVSRTLDSAGLGTVTAVTFQYEAGLLVTKTDGRDTITYINDRGRVVAIEDSLFGERTTFDYDEAGRLASFTDGGSAEDDDDADAPAGFGEPSFPAPRTSVVIDVVRDERGRPARFDERDGSGTVRLGRDAAGRLVSLEEVDEASGETGLRQTLTRDDRGRVVGIDIVDRDTDDVGPGGELKLTYRIVHEADRLASIEARRSRGTVLVEARTALEYTADGLLERSTTVVEVTGEEGTARSTEVSTYEYESPACAPQVTNDPRRALLVGAFDEPRATIAALECGYYLDDDF